MTRSIRSLLRGLVLLGTAIAAAASATADEGTLELKRLPLVDRQRIGDDYMYRATSPQHFFAQWHPGQKGVAMAGNGDQAAAFKKLVTKEPEYASENPFRGVAKFGSQEFAFALDFVDPKAEKDAAADKADDKATDKKKDAKAAEKDAKAESPLGALGEAIAKEVAEEATPPKMAGYNRLYFDFNRNGDLTDDKVLEGEIKPFNVTGREFYAQLQFPRVDVTIDVGGTPLDYSFFVSGYVNVSKSFAYTQVQINSAVYREGDITLDGKQRHIVLIDFNSNGRFDDETKVLSVRRGMAAQETAYPQAGDMLLIDPKPGASGYDSPYDITASTFRNYVSKLVRIDDKFYDVKVTPAGDRVTLTPSSVALGAISNPNGKFRAVIYSDQAVLKIEGTKDTPAPVPEGEWKLLSYTLDLTGMEEPKPAEEKATGGTPLLDALAKTAESLLGGRAAPGGRYRSTLVAANASGTAKAVAVGKGETVLMPFGPPYKPLVTAYGNGEQLEMELSLIGSAGEVCSNMTVDGNRPPKPHFTIKDPQGEVVQQGDFEYG